MAGESFVRMDVARETPRSTRFRTRLGGRFALVAWCAFMAMAPHVAHAAEIPGLLDMEHLLSKAFETPHTPWAKPYAQGTVRVLFFAPWAQGSTDGREIVELMQRFDLEADAAYYLPGPARLLGDGNPRWYDDPQAGTNRVLRLLQMPYDVFFLNHVKVDGLPKAVQSALEEQVHGGAGLVVVGDSDASPFKRARRLDDDADGRGLGGQPYRCGQGRILLMPSRERLEYAAGWETHLDYQMARQGRGLLWAAGRPPRPALEVSVPAEAIDGARLPGEVVTVTWAEPLREATLRVEVRRWDGHRESLGAVDAAGESSAHFTLPWLRAGEYHVDVFAESASGIENWASASFTVKSERRIEAVKLAKEWAEVGEMLRGEAALGGRIEPGDSLRVRLLDKRGRVLAQKDYEAATTTPFDFTIESWMPMLLRVEAVILNDGREVASEYGFLRVTKRHQNQFNFVVWNIPSGDLAPYGVEALATYGATSILQGGDPPLSMSASELSYVPYAASFRKSSHTVTAMLDPDGIMKGGCLYDEAKMREWVDSVVERYQLARGHGVFVYSLGDENAVRGSCLSSHCLAAYHEYLRNVYGDIAALNAEWDADYAAFEDVALLTEGELPDKNAPRWFKEYYAQRLQKDRTDNEGAGDAQIALGGINEELRALQGENYARWYDRQAFQCYTYVEWCKRFLRAFKELDPQALTGFEGTDSFTIRRLTTRSRQGGDLDAFVRELEYFGPYGGPANEVVRSIAPPNFPMGNWTGYSMKADVLLDEYWGQITNCMNTVQWWRWDNLDGYHGYLAPTFVPFPATQELLDDTRVVREGLGDLLMHCEMQDDAVAMLYSMPSTHIAHFDGNRTYGNYKRDHALWHDAIHEAGLQFRYVTDRMLRLGEFDAGRFKALILPLAFAIGPEEAEVIRDFVRGGGTLIADVRPGIYDGHCKPLDAGVLDDVFGIERTGKQDAIALDRMSVDGEIAGRKIAMRWGNWEGHEIYPQMHVDPTVTVTTGKELGKAFPIHFWYGLNHPVCIVNEFAKGRGVLLNFAIYNAPVHTLIRELLGTAGVTAVVGVETPEGDPAPDIEITRWRNGDIELLALLGKYDGQARVTLPAAKSVYDLKSKEALGHVEGFVTSLRPNSASFFALLPEPAPLPEIMLKRASVFAGAAASARIRVPGAEGSHALRVSAVAPDGEPAPWLDKTLIIGRKARDIALPFAYNDPTGDWRIRVADLYSGESAEAVVRVEPD